MATSEWFDNPSILGENLNNMRNVILAFQTKDKRRLNSEESDRRNWKIVAKLSSREDPRWKQFIEKLENVWSCDVLRVDGKLMMKAISFTSRHQLELEIDRRLFGRSRAEEERELEGILDELGCRTQEIGFSQIYGLLLAFRTGGVCKETEHLLKVIETTDCNGHTVQATFC